MKKKLKLSDIKIESFITEKEKSINGGWDTKVTNVNCTFNICITGDIKACSVHSIDYCNSNFCASEYCTPPE